MYNIKMYMTGYLLQLSLLPFNLYILSNKVKEYVKDKREHRKSAVTRCWLSLKLKQPSFPYNDMLNRYVNLRDLLTSSKLPNPNPTPKRRRGSQPCGRLRCSVCQHVKTADSVTSHSTGRTVKIPFNSTCTSIDVVYMIKCCRCGIQYVGQTSNTIITRLRQHLRDIRLVNEYKTVSVHFNSAGHSLNDVIMCSLDTSSDLNARLRLEEASIHEMNTAQPQGLNQRF